MNYDYVYVSPEDQMFLAALDYLICELKLDIDIDVYAFMDWA